MRRVMTVGVEVQGMSLQGTSDQNEKNLMDKPTEENIISTTEDLDIIVKW